jgi:hypothetical protein
MRVLKAVDCITFGTPPVSSQPIPCQGGSRLLSIINEGDLVVLAQESYIKELLEIYALPPKRVQMKIACGFEVPAPYLRISGTCVLLKENEDDGDEDEDGDEEVSWTAYEVEPSDVERAFFGDHRKHMMTEYVRRVKFLSQTDAQKGIGED